MIRANSTSYDMLHRPLHDLRISVIDRCNFRCSYCMPEEDFAKHYAFVAKENWLGFDEIQRLVHLFVQLGVKKIRLTGGEPLLRPQLEDLIKNLTGIAGIEDLALTTNGSLLAEMASKLKNAGLKRLTVSLDTLDSRIFHKMNGNKSSVGQVIEGIQAAQACGFESIKINVVVQKGVNDHTILDLVKYFRGTSCVLRFIEYMDVGNCNHWDMKYVVPSSEIMKKIDEHFPLESIGRNYTGEVAERYRFKDGEGEIGFISSISQPFCQDCSRARISTDGQFFTCLFAQKGFDIRTPLRNGASDTQILNSLRDVWKNRKDRYSEARSASTPTDLPSRLPKVEMFQIGG